MFNQGEEVSPFQEDNKERKLKIMQEKNERE